MATFTDVYADKAGVLDDTSKARSNIYESRLRLLHKALVTAPDGGAADPGKIVSIGVGSGIFETLLDQRYGIRVAQSVEPSAALGARARAKGLDVVEATAQGFDYGAAPYDTIVYNGSSFGFIPDDEIVETFSRNKAALARGGRIVLTDVPAESALGIALRFIQEGSVPGRVAEEALAGTAFFNVSEHSYKPYWHEIGWYVDVLRKAGFTQFGFWQTIPENPPYHNERIEDPTPGYKSGNYVAIVAS
ncbi:MAG: hypothetical protein PUF97_06155 [Bifidobacteriaceae bacterium]|nr:hypothetical protein [Bifidobacteriaceae bacterium]